MEHYSPHLYGEVPHAFNSVCVRVCVHMRVCLSVIKTGEM